MIQCQCDESEADGRRSSHSAHSSVAVDDEALVEVIRAAHRLQMDQITVIAMKLAVTRISSLRRLALCYSLSLDEIRMRHEVAERDALLARQFQDDQRKLARQPQEGPEGEGDDPTKSAAATPTTNVPPAPAEPEPIPLSWWGATTSRTVEDTRKRDVIEQHKWLVQAFVDVVLDFCPTAPSADPDGLLDDGMRWLIVNARQTISSARAQKIFINNDKFMTSSSNRYHPRDVANLASVLPFVARVKFATEVLKKDAITLNTNRGKSPQFIENQLTCVGMSQADLERWVPSAADEKKVVEDVWFASRSKSDHKST